MGLPWLLFQMYWNELDLIRSKCKTGRQSGRSRVRSPVAVLSPEGNATKISSIITYVLNTWTLCSATTVTGATKTMLTNRITGK